MATRQNTYLFTVGTTIGRLNRSKLFRLNYLSPIDLHMVVLTVVDVMLTLCFAITTRTVPMSNKASIEYHGGSTSNGKETKFTCEM